jgi:hypothetical protein
MPDAALSTTDRACWQGAQNGLVYVWAFSMREQLVSPAFTKRQQMLSPDQYEIVDVRTLRGVRRAMLFPKALLQAEFAANREVLASKRERLRAKRVAKQPLWPQ